MENEAPIEEKRCRLLPWWAWLLLGLLILIFLILALPLYGQMTPRAHQTKVLSNAKQIALAVKIYAIDHEGRAPGNLEELVTSGALPKDFLESTKKKFKGSPIGDLEYLLEPGVLLDSLSPDTPIIRVVYH